MLKIGEFSKMAKLTVGALRYYDKMGLLQPVYTDAESGYRYYAEEQLGDVLRIVELRGIGLSIREIREVLDGEELAPLLEHRKIEIEREQARLAAQRDRIAALLSGEETKNVYTAVVRDIPPQNVFSCQGVIRSIAAIHDFITSCHREFRRLNPDLPYAEPDYCCLVYPEESFRETGVRVEYAQAVARHGAGNHFLTFRTLPGVRAVSVEHYGSEKNLRSAYSFALRWAGEHGYRVNGQPREQYVCGPWNREREEDYLTIVQLPVTAEENE